MRGVLRVSVSAKGLHAEALHRGAVIWAAQAAYESPAELTDVIARLAAEPPRPCRRLVVRLERPPVQIRTLADLPPVKARQLAALVAHQAGRFFRRNGDPLVTDAVWVQNGPSRVARGAAVGEPLVEAIAAGARAAGLVLEGITPVADGPPLSLLPMSERAARERRARLQARRFGILAAAMWLAAGAAFATRLLWERRTVERELAQLGPPLAAVLAARRELRDAEAAVRAVSAAERLRGRSLALLDAVTRALPDSAVLTSLAWTDEGSGVLSGAARRAADVVADLERGGALAAPHLEGPVVREAFAGRPWERFTILFGEATRAGKREGL